MRRRCKECQEARAIASRSSKQVAPPWVICEDGVAIGQFRTCCCVCASLCCGVRLEKAQSMCSNEHERICWRV